VLFVPVLVLLAFSNTTLLVDARPVVNGTLWIQLGPLNYFFLVYFVSYFLWSTVNLLYTFRTSSVNEQTRYKYFFAGLFITIVIGAFFNLVMTVMFRRGTFVYFGPLSSIFVTTFTAYAVLKHRLMDISLAIKKTTAYSLVTFGITFSYVLVVIGFEFMFRVFYGHYSFWGSIPAAFVIAITFVPVRERLQNVTDQIFFRRTIEYQNIIKEVTRLIVSVTDLNTLFRLIDRTIVRAMCVKNVAVLLFEEREEQYLVEKTNGHPADFLNQKLAPNSPLASFLKEKRDAVVLEECQALTRSGATPQAEKDRLANICQELKRFEAVVAIPSFTKDRLVGILCLGEKLSGEPYSPDDLELLFMMSSEAGIAIENAKLYRDITETRDYLNNLVQGSDDAIITMDLKGQVMSWNQGAKNIFGYEAKETVGQLPPIFEPEELSQLMNEVMLGKEVKTIQLNKKSKYGSELALLLTLSPIKDPDGKIMGISAILKDITELKKVDRLKQEFLSIISHELRTPLTPIKGYLSLFLNNSLGKLTPKQKAALKTIMNQSNHLQDLIDSVIDISRIDAGRPLELKREPVFLEDIINSAVEAFELALQNKEIKVGKVFAAEHIAIMGDRNKLMRAIVNLLGNAINFTPPGGSITIKVEKEANKLVVKLIDTGIGLAKEHLLKIFNSFYQVDTSYTRASGGIGMGLAVARQIVESHGGRIWAESEGMGRGSQFILAVPFE